MRVAVTALVLGCLGVASTVEARGLEYGPWLAISRPTRDAREGLNPGIAYGLTATYPEGSRAGYGVDVVYHRWPGRPEVDRSLDALLSLFSDVPITGTRITVSALQATLHGKFFALDRGRVLPWVKAGVGVHRVNTKIELPIAAMQAGGLRVVKYSPDNIKNRLGLLIGVGLDLGITSRTKLSLDGSYHLITADPNRDITVFAIGAGLLNVPR